VTAALPKGRRALKKNEGPLRLREKTSWQGPKNKKEQKSNEGGAGVATIESLGRKKKYVCPEGTGGTNSGSESEKHDYPEKDLTSVGKRRRWDFVLCSGEKTRVSRGRTRGLRGAHIGM